MLRKKQKINTSFFIACDEVKLFGNRFKLKKIWMLILCKLVDSQTNLIYSVLSAERVIPFKNATSSSSSWYALASV